MTMFHMTNDSALFRTAGHLKTSGWTLRGNIFEQGSRRMLPLYEAKMIHHYNHRFGDYAGVDMASGKGVRALPTPSDERLRDPDYVVIPRYWVGEDGVQGKLGSISSTGWLLAWRLIASSLDERTMIISLLPRAAVGNSLC